MKLRIFCDFDGTVAQNDVGNLIFTRFGDTSKWWSLVDNWKAKRIDGRELWRRQASETHMTEAELDEFAASQPLDPTFFEFVRFCRQNKFQIYVVSDGMDAYIRRILDHNGLGDLQVRANHLHIHVDGSLAVEFPYYEEGCRTCANCKGLHVSRETLPGEKTVYIGDGYSDICALSVADLTFAKRDLLQYCRDENIYCIPFNDFADVRTSLITLLSDDNVKND